MTRPRDEVPFKSALDALAEARRAWERSEPQYVIPGVLDDPAAPPSCGGIVERAALTSGAGPCRDDEGLTAPSAAAPARSGAPAPTQNYGDGRSSAATGRARPQEGA